ncbi:MAG TPA: CocE/NonD family hydrolase, partial [Pirellulaceae bacterium]|nr:CocE/NonD family hydrolase [Pirellulaceae bacterium]
MQTLRLLRMRNGARIGPRIGAAALIALATLHGAAARAEVTVETIQVSMRDGVKLATDVYRDSAVTKAPVVLMRTPYNKERAKPAAERFASAGYVAVVQDCRGKFASAGEFIPYNNEGQDGYDAIEWLGRQPWCNGRVGM